MNYRRSHRLKTKKPKLKTLFFSFLFIFSIGLLIYFFLFSDFFTLKNITISGNNKISQEEILIKAQEEINTKKFQIISNNLLLFDLENVKENILSSFPLVSNVKMDKKFPNAINISISERMGKVIFCGFFNDNFLEECFVVDSEGIVFEEFSVEDQLLPKIRNVDFQEALILGNQIIEKKLLSTILNFNLGVEDINIQLKEFLIISDIRINAITLEGWEIYFNPKEDIEWQLTKLDAVLDKKISLEERKDLEYVELRFGNTAPFKWND